MKKKLKRAILRMVLSEKEQKKLRTNFPILPEELIPITQTSDKDIFIVGYPKSGNTWMQNLISSMIFGIDGALLPDTLTQELVPDVYAKKYYKRFHDVCFFKSHELPHRYMKKVIYLIRDGRDAMASYYAMNKALGKAVTLEEMIIEGKEIYPSKWHQHIRAWLDNPYQADMLIVKYEDLISNTYTELNKILDFINVIRSDEIIERAINGNSFKQMQRKEAIYGSNNKNWNPTEKFIRRGEIGSYKDEISFKLIEFFEREAEKELIKLNYLVR